MKKADSSEFEYKQLNTASEISKRQYKDIASLIFGTDPFIYPALFGEGETGIKNAEALLPPIIEAGTDSMFNKNNLFICFRGRKICGLILWCKGIMTWKPGNVLRMAEEKGIPLNKENVLRVGKEYVDDRYNDGGIGETVLSLINICIRRDMRGKGIGRSMLGAFIEMHPGEKMELVVIKDNAPAVKLYERSGFSVVSESEGFSLTDQKPVCFTMIR